MRGIVIRVLNTLSMVGILLAIVTGAMGFIGVPTPVFSVAVGCLIGLLGGVTNLMVLLAILEVRQGILSAGQVITVQEAPVPQMAAVAVNNNSFRPIRVQYNLSMAKPHPVRDRLTDVAQGIQTIRSASNAPAMPYTTLQQSSQWQANSQNDMHLH